LVHNCHSIADIITDYYKITASNAEVPYYAKLMKALEKTGTKDIKKDLDQIMHNLSSLRFDNPVDTIQDLFYSRVSLTTSLYDLLEKMPKFLMDNKGLLSAISSLYNRETHFCNKCQHWSRLRSSVKYVEDYQKSDEVVSFSLTPLRVDTVVEPMLKTLSKKRQFMSATIFPRVFMKYIGLREPFRYVQLPSNIPKENRQVIINPVASFNNSNLNKGCVEFEDLVDVINSLLEFHSKEGHSGVIFTPSYKLSSLLKKELDAKAKKLGYKILTNYGADGRDFIIEQFRNIKVKKRLLISPSFSEGINFEDDISRFQIIVKAPFKSLGDTYVKEKISIDREWYELDCIMKVLQSCGRSCRHSEDYSISYLLDGNILRLYKKYKADIPDWFKEAVIL
jgi:Rad3-related DNA helicase